MSYADQLRDPHRPRPPRTPWQDTHEQPPRALLRDLYDAEQAALEAHFDELWDKARRGEL